MACCLRGGVLGEWYVGGREMNKPVPKKLKAGRGPVGKTAVVGAKDRKTNYVSAAVVENTDRPTLHKFIQERVRNGAAVYTDSYAAYRGFPNHVPVKKHGRFVGDQAHTNGVESFWSMLKRGYHGTYHRVSPKHLHRYVNEFTGRHNARPLDTVDQMTALVRGMDGKRLRYRELIR